MSFDYRIAVQCVCNTVYDVDKMREDICLRCDPEKIDLEKIQFITLCKQCKIDGKPKPESVLQKVERKEYNPSEKLIEFMKRMREVCK